MSLFPSCGLLCRLGLAVCRLHHRHDHQVPHLVDAKGARRLDSSAGVLVSMCSARLALPLPLRPLPLLLRLPLWPRPLPPLSATCTQYAVHLQSLAATPGLGGGSGIRPVTNSAPIWPRSALVLATQTTAKLAPGRWRRLFRFEAICGGSVGHDGPPLVVERNRARFVDFAVGHRALHLFCTASHCYRPVCRAGPAGRAAGRFQAASIFCGVVVAIFCV